MLPLGRLSEDLINFVLTYILALIIQMPKSVAALSSSRAMVGSMSN